MRLFLRTVLLATPTALFLGLSGLSPASDDANDRMRVDDTSPAHDRVPAPIVRDHHLPLSAPPYEAQPADGACWTADDVLRSFILDIENVGGEIVLMAEGIQQDFADSWRSLVDARRVEVSLVVAHVIPGRSDGPIVDVAEIDSDGCALSRTLLTADDWMALIALAASRFSSNVTHPVTDSQNREPPVCLLPLV